jgi:AcrR family transcriptional regulator
MVASLPFSAHPDNSRSIRISMVRATRAKIGKNGPQQSRSRATVQVILDAAVRILDQESSDAATTSRIAEVAGVSVGTLYQYFANKDAILDALQEREFERAMELIASFLASPKGTTEVEVARSIVEGLLVAYRRSPGLHRALALEGLRVTPTERVLAFDLRVTAAVRDFLRLAGDRIRRKNLDAAAFVVHQTVRATLLAYLLEGPAGIDDAAISEEVTELIVRYLANGT